MNVPSLSKIGFERDPLDDPSSAFGKLDEDRYKAELDLVDRYQLFVAEMLRLSLGGLAIFGFIYEKMFSPTSLNATAPFATQAKTAAAVGVLLLGICAASALVFRYFATEGARYYIEALRFAPPSDATDVPRSSKSLQIRRKRVKICKISKAFSAVSLGLGGVLIAASFFLGLLSGAPK
jgi:hypothetical protein